MYFLDTRNEPSLLRNWDLSHNWDRYLALSTRKNVCLTRRAECSVNWRGNGGTRKSSSYVRMYTYVRLDFSTEVRNFTSPRQGTDGGRLWRRDVISAQ